MKLKAIGIDLAKDVFGVHGVRRARQSAGAQAGRSPALTQFDPCQVGMEACASAHYWASLKPSGFLIVAWSRVVMRLHASSSGLFVAKLETSDAAASEKRDAKQANNTTAPALQPRFLD